MLKNREAAKMLENIVGLDNFSEDPVILSSYTFVPFAYIYPLIEGSTPKDIWDRAKLGAVIMPRSTEEVQMIVKVCNRYKINFKAFSTGMGAWGMPIKEGSLQVDMRRMNKIIELDDKNMYAVVESYVSHRELAVEASKKGLTCHVIGAGSQTSVLASLTSQEGTGHDSLTTGHSARNCIGAEWVTPTGEVVKWGLVEKGKAGYPGPGLSGIYRGWIGALGGLGIFTKAAVKLYPWPGPPQLEMTGKNPTPGYKIPENFKIYLLGLPSAEAIANAIYRLTETQIAYHAWLFPLFFHPQRWMGESNDDHYEIWKNLQAAGVIEKSFNQLTVILSAYSEKELSYKQKVMEDIIKEIGAQEFLPEFLTEHDKERFFCAQIAVNKPCTEFRTGGGEMGTSNGAALTWDINMKMKNAIFRMQKKYIDENVLTDFAGETCWGGPIEQRAMGHTEFVHFTNPRNAELRKRQAEFVRETVEFAKREKWLGQAPYVIKKIGMDKERLSPFLGDYFDYKRKIKEALDPDNVADATIYIGPTED